MKKLFQIGLNAPQGFMLIPTPTTAIANATLEIRLNAPQGFMLIPTEINKMFNLSVGLSLNAPQGFMLIPTHRIRFLLVGIRRRS